MTAERIVIAEDEADIRTNLSRLLRIEGYEVRAAEDGQAALDLVRQDPPDLLLSDVMMPRMTGHELLAAVRSEPRTAHLPVVLLTARADRSDVREGMNIGADDYLTKPFQRAELLASIRARLDKAASQRQAAQRLAEQAHRLTHFDAVTGLPNRGHLLLLLEQALRGATADAPVAVWVVGVDRRMTADPGAIGMDVWLRALAQRLAQLSAAGGAHPLSQAVVARVGDDRVVQMAPLRSDGPAGAELASAWLAGLSEPFELRGQEQFASLALGWAQAHDPSTPATQLLARAEQAMVAAWQQPGTRLLHAAMSGTADAASTGAAAVSNWTLHNDLHRALERQEMRAWFQPQVAASSSAALGFEALIRWQHQQLGLVSPLRFISLAEDNGQIVSLGAWMLEQACRFAVRTSTPAAPMRVAVNLSARQLHDPQLAAHVQWALDATGLPPDQLELEITEGTLMQDLQHTLALLQSFKAMGVQLAIDDFGTGYSSLAYLKRFPLDVLKIDQAFVRNLCTDPDDQAIVKTVIALARSLGLSSVAEGVETEAQHQMLRDMGCDVIQGYLWGKPMPADEAVDWLVRRATKG
jgi:diguanylate cyclase